MQDETDRRSVLRLLAGGCLVAAGLPRLIGCAARVEDEGGPVSVDRAEAERAGRVVVTWDDQPVELLYTGEGFEARSLACTHLGCTVRWDPEVRRYACPCHAGFYDADGVPVSGPPLEPLRTVPVRVAEDRVIVGT